MNSKVFVAISLLVCEAVHAGPRYKIDGVKVVIFGRESTDILTESDTRRPGLDGSLRPMDDLVLERLMFQDAKAMKQMVLDDEAIDRALKRIQQENNMTLEQLQDVFKSAGYTYAEGREQFSIMTTVNSLLDFKIRSRLLVPEKEVRAYFNENPVHEDASFRIERAFVPLSSVMSEEKLRKQLIAYARGENEFPAIEWSPSFWVSENELADDRKFIASLDVDQISAPEEVSGGFELFRVKEKREHRLKPLEERYAEIANELRKPRYERLFEEYKKSLFDSASIVYFN